MNDNQAQARDGELLQQVALLSLPSATSLDGILHKLLDQTTVWLGVAKSGLWWIDGRRNGFRLAHSLAPQAINAESNFLPYEMIQELGVLTARSAVAVSNQSEVRLPNFSFASSLISPIYYGDRLTALIAVFPDQLPASWRQSQQEILSAIAKNGSEICFNFETRNKLQRLVESLQEMSEKTTKEELSEIVLREGLAMLNCDRAVVRGLDPKSGHLTFETSRPTAKGFTLPSGEGITGLALQEEAIYRIADVTSSDWASKYRCLWTELTPTRSELAVPILLRKYRIHVGTRKDFVNRPLGVLNFESPTIAAFSELDKSCAEIIAQRIAPMIERIEYDQKLGKVRKASEELAKKRNWDSIATTLVEAVRDALGYEFVSLSTVDRDAGMIRCIRVLGLGEAEGKEFIKNATHRLDISHVQTDVIEHKRIEVPDPADPRLREITEKFKLDRFIRVFVPMQVRNQVIATISAGYDLKYRKHIYWRDIQLLKILATFGANAMQLYQRENYDRISHEVNAPLTSVRGQIERLLTKRKLLSEDQLERALLYMETDTTLLHYQLQKMDYILGGAVTENITQPLITEPVYLFRDIIFKTINQLTPLVEDHGLNSANILYSFEDIRHVKEVYVDKSKISQVIFNLFMNAVKYAESPDTFQIHIGAEQSKYYYVIKFSDYGIGIPEGLEDEIFEDRFRAPVAIERAVIGSGLGLTIARQLMRDHGGDLILAKRHKPTEFHLLFPKKLRRPS